MHDQLSPATPLTKAQRYEERRKEKEVAALRRQQKDKRTAVVRWAGIGIVVVAAIAGLIWLGKSAPSSPAASGTLDPVTVSDHVTGKAGSSVTFLEYGDFQCPACGSFHPFIAQLKAEYANRVQFSFRNFPLTQHQHANLAARAAEAASAQGKFWEMHDKLYEQQGQWVNSNNVQDVLMGYAKDIGLDVERWQRDLESAEVKNKVTADYASGVRAGVDSTPTFFVGGKKLPAPRNYDDLKKAIEAALAAN